jgi:hypothetical protein
MELGKPTSEASDLTVITLLNTILVLILQNHLIGNSIYLIRFLIDIFCEYVNEIIFTVSPGQNRFFFFIS